MAKGQGYLGSTSVIEELEKIRIRQGLTSSTTTSGTLVGMIAAVVSGSATKTIFPSTTTAITAPVNLATAWTIAGLDSYNIVITLNGTGMLVPGVDYNITTGTTINRLGGATYVVGETYTIMLFAI